MGQGNPPQPPDRFFQHGQLRHMQQHDGLHIHQSSVCGQRLEALHLLRPGGQRFFAEHVLAVFEKQPALRGVQNVGAGDVHRVDVRARGHPRGIGEYQIGPVPGGEFPAPLLAAGAHGPQRHPGHTRRPRQKRLGDPSRADDAVSYRHIPSPTLIKNPDEKALAIHHTV